jgi:hypothetical protein
MRVQDLLAWLILVALFLGGLAYVLEGLREDDGGTGLLGVVGLALALVLGWNLLRRRAEWLKQRER